MQSITPNLKFILGWLKSPFAPGEVKSVMPVNAGIQVTDKVRHTVGKRYPV